MKVTTLNFEEISDILDIAVTDNKSFAIMCYGDLAKEVQNYMAELYGIEDLDAEEIDLDGEYFVSSLPAENGEEYMLFIEDVYGLNNMKTFECDCEMMIFTDVDSEDVDEYIEARSVGYYEYLDEEETEECDCLDCTVERFKNMIIDTSGCPDCIENILKDFVCVIFEKIHKD